MKTGTQSIFFAAVVSLLLLAGCNKEGPPGPTGATGKDATVYYSEWFSPVAWAGTSGDWYFEANAPDLTQDIVENGVVLAYVWLDGDLYNGSSVRPLPARAVGANWGFLIYKYGSIEFTSDQFTVPLTTHKFRFVAIPGTIPAAKSAIQGHMSPQELKSLSYQDICRIYNIPE